MSEGSVEVTSETVTFLFTDIEGSTRLLQTLGVAAWSDVLETETRLVVGAAEAAGGRAFGTEGDAHFLVFSNAPAAIRAAAAAQRALETAPWPAGSPIRVRMGIHTGEVLRHGADYAGLALHRVARIAAAGHGGQVLVSATSTALVGDRIDDLVLRDLGEFRLKDLERPERIAQLAGPGLRDTFPALKTLDLAPNNLPTQLTTFVGRAEIAVARALLGATRLLTLTGPGGTGKTRLSIALASEVMDDHPDGVWFVPLAAVTDPELVAPAIATAVGLVADPTRSPLERVAAHFAGRRALLVLDNFEQVVDAAPVVAELLRAAPRLTVVVSSRAALRISGEQEFAVPPLSLPEPGVEHDPERLMASEAVRLFLERATAVRPDLTLTGDNGPAIADVVRRLDGLPLAIELAAARVRILPPRAIASRLDDRLGLLVGGARDLPARQRTLRGAIEWSHDLLDPIERRLFARLGVFVGGGRLDTAEGVCSDSELGVAVLDGTASLAEQSLLRVIEDAHADARFLMLETIREFAVERLEASAESAALRDRHASAYLELAREMAPRLYTSERRVWLDRFEEDHDNLRAAIAWRMATGDVVAVAELLLAMWRFWQSRGHVLEGRMRAGQVLSMGGFDDAPLRTRIEVLEVAGGLAYWAGDIAAAHTHYQAQLALARELGDDATLANTLYNAGFAPLPVYQQDAWAESIGDLSEPIVDEALAIWRRLGDASGLARGTWMLGELKLFQRDYAAADGHYTEAIGRFEALGDDFGGSWAYFTRGIARAQDHPDAAIVDLRAALQRFRAAGELPGMAFVALAASAIVHEAGDPLKAQRLLGIGTRFREDSGAFLAALTPPGYYLSLDPAPDTDALRPVYDEGYALARDAAIDVLAADLAEPLPAR